MTDNAFKKSARQHQKATGESYTRARRHVDKRTSDEDSSTAALLAALGITDTRHIDPAALWAPRQRPAGEPAGTDQLLTVPIGLSDDGTPLWLDLKDAAEGGSGPHNLVSGSTGSGKKTLLRALVFGLLVRHSPDVVQVILGDPKGEGGWAEFAAYPHTAAIFDDNDALVDHVLDLIDQRGRTLRDAGVELRGKGFDTIAQYNTARQTPAGKDLPPLPTVFVVVDELASASHHSAEYVAAAFGLLLRKGRSLGLYAMLATQTVAAKHVKPQIMDCISQWIALRVTHRDEADILWPGLDAAAHIPDDRDGKGTGFVATAPGADAIRFRSFRVPDSLVRTVGRQLATVTSAES